MSDRTLLPYQRAWVTDQAGLKLIEKSRRIGISWAEAYDAVLHAGEGKGDVYYQSFTHDMARGFIDDAAEWARALQVGAEAVGEVLVQLTPATAVQAFRVRLASGRSITAMSSAPRGFRSRGRPGDVAIVDEAAFVDDLAEVLKAAMAFRVWGGTVHVISTHNGAQSAFAQLASDIRDKVQPGSLHTVPLRAALDQGLYSRICEVSGQPWSQAAEEAWEASLRAEYGGDAQEELDCIPAAGGGAWLSWAGIGTAEHVEAGDPQRAGDGPVWIGVDVARRRDLWVAAVLEQVGDVLWLRELREERNIRFSEQRDIVRELVQRYGPVRVAVDQTGMGEMFVEALQDDHGTTVEGVLLTAPRRLSVATALLEVVEDRRLRIPKSRDLRLDLHSVRSETGPTGGPRLIAEGTDTGHSDRFWALALGCAAASSAAGPFTYQSARPREVLGLTDRYLGTNSEIV